MSIEKDAERWRKLAAFLRLEVEERTYWEPVSESAKRRVEEKVIEWNWTVDVHPDHSWKLYGNTKDESRVPKTIADVIDALPSPDAASDEGAK